MSPAALLIIFVTITAVCGGTYLLVNRTLQSRDAAQVHRRVVGNVTSSDEKGKKTAETLFARDRDEDVWKWLLKKFNVDGQLTALLEQAGKHWAPGQVCITCLGFALVAFNVWWSQAPPLFQKLAFLAAPAAAWIPILYLKRVRTKRIDAFEAQFPDSLLFMSRAMKTGHAFSVSLEMLHHDFAEPLGGEFRRVFEKQNLGLPIDTALEKLGRRVPLMDLKFFIAAVMLQKRTGGNLAEILESLATLIRERFKLRGKIKSISAHGRLSSGVLTAIPAVVAGMMYFVNRDHMMFFVEEETGQWMMGLAIAFQGLGYYVMRQIVKIEV